MELFWQKAARQKADIKKGKELLAYYRGLSKKILEEKENKDRRQVELWSVGDLNDSLNSEYKDVSGNIAYLIKQDLAIKEYIKSLDAELYHCQFGQCDALVPLLTANPLAAVDAKVPIVDFAKQTVS